jgi:membrane associated rhomboid family serine protease
MTLPIRTDSPLRRTPWMNWALIAANVVIFLGQRFSPGITERFQLFPLDPAPTRFITYAFLHASWAHLLGNMLFLYIFGNNVNDKMGPLAYLGFYLAGAVVAALVYTLADQQAPIVGASGAIAAVIGAYLVLFPRSNITVVNIIYVIGVFEIASIWFILFWVAFDVFLNFASNDNVAHVAHIGGTIFGFIVCVVLLLTRMLPRDQFDIVALFDRWNRRRQYRGLVSKGYNPFDPAPASGPARTVNPTTATGPYGAPAPFDPVSQRVMELRAEATDAAVAHDLPRAAEIYRQMRKLDPLQVLSRQVQLDVANLLANQQRYSEAAEAYEAFLRVYPKYEQIEKVELMLGLIYARYLAQYQRAREYLNRALPRLHGDREVSMARTELDRISGL